MFQSDFNQRVIRVNAPQMAKFNAAIQLTDDTTAGDIVEKFRQTITEPGLPPVSMKTSKSEPSSPRGKGNRAQQVNGR